MKSQMNKEEIKYSFKSFKHIQKVDYYYNYQLYNHIIHQYNYKNNHQSFIYCKLLSQMNNFYNTRLQPRIKTHIPDQRGVFGVVKPREPIKYYTNEYKTPINYKDYTNKGVYNTSYESYSGNSYKNNQSFQGYNDQPPSYNVGGAKTPDIKTNNNFFRKDIQKKPLTPLVGGRKTKSPVRQYSPSNRGDNTTIKDKRDILERQLGEYQRLQNQLSALQGKISLMKENLDRKRDEKKKFIEKEQRDRTRFQEELNKKFDRNDKKKDKLAKKNVAEGLKGMVTQAPLHKQLHAFNFNPYSPRHNHYYVSEIVRAYEEEQSLAREHVISSMQILALLKDSKPLTKEQIAPKILKLQKKSDYLGKFMGNKDKKTIVFDLDETLIHCNENTNIPYDVKLPIQFPTGEIVEAGINIRPYTTEILKSLSKDFQIIVFTASHSCYANVVLNYLDPQNKYVHHRLFREHCYASPEGMYIKDLRILNRNLNDVVLVDNAAYSYAFQIDNGIPIIPFYEGKVDFELRALEIYLKSLLLVKDVREVNKKTFKIHRYCQYETIQTLVKQLYYEEFK